MSEQTTKKLTLDDLKARLGQTAAAPRNETGSPAVLRLNGWRFGASSYCAIMILRKNGLSLRDAKTPIERVLRGDQIEVTLPLVQDPDGVIRDLGAQGFDAEIYV